MLYRGIYLAVGVLLVTSICAGQNQADKLGREDSTPWNRLVQQLGDTDYFQRDDASRQLEKAATQQLENGNRDALKAIERGLISEDAEIRNRCTQLVRLVDYYLEPLSPSREPKLASQDSLCKIQIQFRNRSEGEVNLYWRDYDGKRVSKGVIAKGETRTIATTYATHPWVVTNSEGETIGLFVVGTKNCRAVIRESAASK